MKLNKVGLRSECWVIKNKFVVQVELSTDSLMTLQSLERVDNDDCFIRIHPLETTDCDIDIETQWACNVFEISKFNSV